jgi:hypothetical protein
MPERLANSDAPIFASCANKYQDYSLPDIALFTCSLNPTGEAELK